MLYNIAVVKDGMVLYKNTDNLPDVIPNQLLGAKAFQNLKCDCGGNATGMSGWVGQFLKMRIKCHKCGKDFCIERKFPGSTLQLDMTDLQRNEESIFLKKYHERLEYKREEPKALEAPEKKRQVYEQRDVAQVIEVDFSREENKLLNGLKETNQGDDYFKKQLELRDSLIQEQVKWLNSYKTVKCKTTEIRSKKKSFWQFLKAFFQ